MFVSPMIWIKGLVLMWDDTLNLYMTWKTLSDYLFYRQTQLITVKN